MDSLGVLAMFVQAAETRSFTATGKAFGVSASAVGKAIARLEDRLGTRLFHRSTRIVTLTHEGALFLERSRRILAEMEAAELELSHTRGAPRGRLRISLPLVGMLMMPTLTAFMRAWPAVELDLDFTDRIVDVIDEGFDAVIRTGEPNDSRLMARMLGQFRFRLVGSPDYLATYGIPVSAPELAVHRCLRHRFPSTGRLDEWPLVWPGDTRPTLPATAVASTIEPLICMAESGLGLACLPEFAVRQQVERGALVCVLDDALRGGGTFRILWPPSRYLAPKTRLFVDFVAERLFAPSQLPGAHGPME
ncbi:LysR family transcriptional regulator [Sphingomonas sp. AP4-R1]|uniref:LysR family transcriptional regulator n=1 Tax=Sphingomonas sp. AP4-R1 TaxID=2735134 RepID=UPI00149352A0|nr:LysR family transcriptional regulator [Sphingomonas sp. AP4-R1]QJU57355.1 LysR family transcriptional regulator [Sphingomonas sp. AP4-R1]